MKELLTISLFEEGHSLAYPFFEDYRYPYEIIPHIGEIVLEIGANLDLNEYDHPSDDVWIHKSAIIHPSASISGPAIIGKESELRIGAFIRENVLIGEGCVIGNSCEIKNAIISDSSQVPHFNYVGDSILGFHAHMGAGAMLSNYKSDGSIVNVVFGERKIATGLMKFGAILGDYAEIGCHSVLAPGTIVGKKATIYPLSFVRGYVKENSIYKKKGEVVDKR